MSAARIFLTAIALTVLITASGLISGCATPQATITEKLRDGVFHYNDARRWNRFEKAAQYLPKDERSDAMATWREDADQTRILEYEIESVQQVEGNKAEIIVKLSAIRRPSNVVKTTRRIQSWTYGEDKKWLIVDERAVKRKRRP